MNIREIAERAGVSAATVSRVINYIPTVDRKLAKRVWNVVGDLGYSPNGQARGLVSGKSRVLGLAVSDMTDSFSSEIIQSFETSAVHCSYEILVTSTLHDPKRIELCVRRMIERRIEGAAVLTFGLEELFVEKLRDRGIPLVCVDSEPDASTVSIIRLDYERGIRQAVQHLVALRHERIAYVAGPFDSKRDSAKRSAFEKCMSEIGIPVFSELIVAGDDTVAGGRRTIAQLAQLRNRPTAIFCSNDMTAIGVMTGACELAFAVPRELSVIGFDDIPFSRFITPPLTTVRVPQAELAAIAFHALVSELDGTQRETGKSTEYVLDTQLVLRRSTALALPWRSTRTNLQSSVVDSIPEDSLMQRAGHDRMMIARS